MLWLSISSLRPESWTLAKDRQLDRCLIIARRADDPSPDIARSLTDRLQGNYYTVAADGGYRLAVYLGLQPQSVIGDMDSCSPADREHMAASGCRVELHPPVKDETDTHLAIDWAVRAGFSDITIMFDHRGRFDHVLSPIWVASAYSHRAHIRLVDVDLEAVVVSGPATITIHRQGLITSLLPLTPAVTGITTQSMKYSLHSGTISWGQSIGISNETTAAQAQVSFATGTLLVTATQHPH